MSLNPSWRTICAMVNSMIGGTMLTLPILFRESGLATGIVILLISGIISYKTCSLYVIHMSDEETEIEQTIRRILGVKNERFFRLITGIYLIFLNVIYVDLITDQAFNVLYFILNDEAQTYITEKNLQEIVFNKISIQIISLVFFLPLLFMMFIKNLSFLVKLTSFGVISSISYTCFILYHFFPNIGHFKSPTWWSPNFGNLAGTCAVAFTIHTVVNPILKSNKKQENNLRDLKISYLIGFLIYGMIGVLGSLPIVGEECKVTIINCYLNEKLALVVEILYLLMLLTVFPCFINVGRTRLLVYLYGEVRNQHTKYFNFGFMFLATTFAFLSPFLRLDLMMNLVGALLTIAFIYYIPIRFHMACLYNNKGNSGIIMSNNEAQEKIKLDDTLITEEDIDNGRNVKCFHSFDYVDKTKKSFRYIVYGIIGLYGIIVTVYGIYDFVDQIIHSK